MSLLQDSKGVHFHVKPSNKFHIISLPTIEHPSNIKHRGLSGSGDWVLVLQTGFYFSTLALT